MQLIKNGNILTMEGPVYPCGYVLWSEGRICGVGDMAELTVEESQCTEVFDAAGLTVMPGLIDAHCHVGLFGEGEGAEGEDGNEDTDPITPQLRAIDAVNPFDEAFQNARNAGVTTVVTGPGSANVLSGQFAALHTAGVCVDEMIVRAPAAQKAALGENPKMVYGEKKQAPATRMATAALLRETLYKAVEYREKKDSGDTAYDSKLESLLPMLDREIPLKVHAHRADDICTALRIAREFHIHITIEHCTEGALIAQQLKRANVPVMLGPMLGNKSKPELKNLSFDTCKILDEAGVSFAIITDHPETPIEYLPLCAGLAVKHGLARETALEAITIRAAHNAGIGDIVGSLAVGKLADMIAFEGDLLGLDGTIRAVWIGGNRCEQ